MGTTSVKIVTSDGVEYSWGELTEGETLQVSGEEIISAAPSASGGGLTQAQALTLVSYRG